MPSYVVEKSFTIKVKLVLAIRILPKKTLPSKLSYGIFFYKCFIFDKILSTSMMLFMDLIFGCITIISNIYLCTIIL